MTTATIPTRRKIIDLNSDTFKALSMMAASEGTNLKHFIESILNRVAESYDDNKMYEWLVNNRPEGQDVVNEEEKKDFESWLGV